ncbi:hypothetical protein CEXT_89641 [Caerostris extrusa]|uniref:Uncharacterized protein n=1 Tax=Caerostris extrusa TaxID=172846 RepID=A0AAV4YA64_CAEEX|nr:hypothetical protein CEXT_89641 [Caerostris extrusa]
MWFQLKFVTLRKNFPSNKRIVSISSIVKKASHVRSQKIPDLPKNLPDSCPSGNVRSYSQQYQWNEGRNFGDQRNSAEERTKGYFAQGEKDTDIPEQRLFLTSRGSENPSQYLRDSTICIVYCVKAKGLISFGKAEKNRTCVPTIVPSTDG